MFQSFLAVIVIPDGSLDITVQVRQVLLEDGDGIFVVTLQDVFKGFSVLFGHLVEFVHDNFLFNGRCR